MSAYPVIAHMLRTAFNADDGLPEEVAVRLYLRAAKGSGQWDALVGELEHAFADATLSWKRMLLNDDYEVVDAATEEEAKTYARRILWTPVFGD